MKKFFCLALLGTAVASAAPNTTWKIDPDHTAAQFSVKHLGISTVRGVFQKTTGTVIYDVAVPGKSQIEATIDAASVDTRVEMRDNDLRSPNFLDVAKYPTITFKSTHVEPAGAGKMKVTGDLTIHGVTKPVVLDVDGLSAPVHAMGGERMGVEATTAINRKDFGVNGAPGIVGDQIQIVLDVEMTAAGK
jgi:polyisoprenoid-binding protein YceI